MHSVRRGGVGLVLAALVLGGCTGASSPTPSASPTIAPTSAPASRAVAIQPILVSSEVVVGPNRFLFSLIGPSNNLIAAPDVPVSARFFDPADAATPAFEADARFIWSIEGERGLYAIDAEFPTAGRWVAELTIGLPEGEEHVRAEFNVAADGSTPGIGESAVSVDTPTAPDVNGDLAQLSSDDDPDPAFYETSVADALADGTPFVLVFATPAFCRTQTCGPMLDNVKAISGDFPDLTFINVEPYEMTFANGHLQPELADGQLQAAEWTLAWGLKTEPWIFVVDGEGKVTAKFEGAVADDELRSAFSQVSANTGGATTAEARGVVVSVDQRSVTDVHSFTLRTDAGEQLVFSLGVLDMSEGGFNAGHLREHMAGATPVAVEYTETDGERVATRLSDAD